MSMLKIFAWVLFGGVMLVTAVGCGGATNPSSASKPSLQIVAPSYGSTVAEGETITVQAGAADVTGVMRVELYVDGQLANTVLATDPKGDVQFQPQLKWVATTPGAHVLVVRAFNAANVSGDATIALNVTARGSEPSPTTVENTPVGDATTISEITTVPDATVENTPVEDATATSENTSVPGAVTIVVITATPPPTNPLETSTPTDAPTTEPTAPSDTSTPVPTRIPTKIPTKIPTAIPPTATIPPIAFQPPFDGGMDISAEWTENGFDIEARANDVAVGDQNGDGIAYVDFAIQALNGDIIATKRESNKPYCFFSEKNGECDLIEQGAPELVWAAGKPIRAGWYFIRAVAHTPDNRIRVAEQAVNITMPVDTFQNVFANIEQPQTDRPKKELTFEADVSGGGAGAGVNHIDMYVVAYNGQIVQARTERTARYCAFGGGDDGQPCPAYNFVENQLKWPNGAPVAKTQYILRAVAFLNDGTVAANSEVIQIDQVQ